MSSLGQLVAGIAHEINNPTSFIYGNITPAKEYAESLLETIALYQEYYPTPEAELQAQLEDLDLEFVREDFLNLLDSIQMGADRIKKIVQSLRIFSRFDEAELKAADIHQGIESTLMLLQNRLQKISDINAIEVVKEYGKLPLVECYPGLLNQVFMNVLVNAIDAIEECNQKRSASKMAANPGQIRIQTQLNESDRQVRIVIADNGCGIPEEVRDRIFDPFFTTKSIGKGTGLGLSMSYSIIVNRHEGSMNCRSILGQGTTFEISIPLKQNSAAKS
jgi:signal transduction histidine kinase